MIEQKNIRISNINAECSIAAIQAMNKYMEGLEHDFPFKRFFNTDSISNITRTDPVYVIRQTNSDAYECICGSRVVKLLYNYSVEQTLVYIIEGMDKEGLIKFAISNNILPLVYWPISFTKNPRAFKFINGLRKCLPDEHKKLIPTTAKLKAKFGLKHNQARNLQQNESSLETLMRKVNGF